MCVRIYTYTHAHTNIQYIDYMSVTIKHWACVAYSEHYASVTLTAAAPTEKEDLTWSILVLFRQSSPCPQYSVYCLQVVGVHVFLSDLRLGFAERLWSFLLQHVLSCGQKPLFPELYFCLRSEKCMHKCNSLWTLPFRMLLFITCFILNKWCTLSFYSLLGPIQEEFYFVITGGKVKTNIAFS